MRIVKYRTELENDLNILVKEKSVNYETENFTNPSIVVDTMRNIFRIDKQTEEYVYAIAVNSKGKPIGFFEISHGSVNMSVVNPREIFIKLLLCGASKFFLVHNHPSQDCTPSKEDFNVTKRIKECGSLMGIILQDHIIVGNGYYSFHESGNI